MKNLKVKFIEIYREHRSLLALMMLVFVFAMGVFIFSLTKLDPTSAVVKVGYGDIGGYRDGAWSNLIVFPTLMILFGVLHNFLAIKIYDKRGVGIAKFFLITTLMLIFGALIVLIRLSSEG